MTTRRIALFTAAAATAAFVLSGRQRRQRHELTRAGTSASHRRSAGAHGPRRNRRR